MSDGFYSCLKNINCGEWHRYYEFKGMKIELSASPVTWKLYSGDPNGIIRVQYKYHTEAMENEDAKKFTADNDSNVF
ncbi:hypothetical protein [Enterobacter asburiae]|uniref:hypothetical protein n=1 Tax=Enterobacter asburiae TaxID=61645 RepID=UPI00117748E9|nr:hypothetical protein [Enterobacter asburiae]